MDIIGGNKTGIVPAAQVEQLSVDLIQLWDIMLLQLEEEAVSAKNFVIPVQRVGGLHSRFPFWIRRGHFGRHAAGSADQPFGMACQEIMIDAGIVIKTVQLGCAGNFQQIL